MHNDFVCVGVRVCSPCRYMLYFGVLVLCPRCINLCTYDYVFFEILIYQWCLILKIPVKKQIISVKEDLRMLAAVLRVGG